MALSMISGCASKSEPADSSAAASVEQETDNVETAEAKDDSKESNESDAAEQEASTDEATNDASESSQDKEWTVVSGKNFSFEAPADSTVKQLDTVTLIMPDEYDDNTYYSIRELPLGDLTDDDYFSQMSEMTSDALADQLIMEPEEFTKEIGGRTIRGMIYSFRN
ncbi:MAG: hypothetical protein KBS83_07545, partial [Lachnospiraceae bacterium]|nr:hypothetical protein [Candidatus Equihabitans merdae]